jgi:hypothetical protein
VILQLNKCLTGVLVEQVWPFDSASHSTAVSSSQPMTAQLLSSGGSSSNRLGRRENPISLIQDSSYQLGLLQSIPSPADKHQVRTLGYHVVGCLSQNRVSFGQQIGLAFTSQTVTVKDIHSASAIMLLASSTS